MAEMTLEQYIGFDISLQRYIKVMPTTRFELAISCLRSKRFATKLHRHGLCQICTDEAEAPELESGGFVYSPNNPVYVYSPPTRRVGKSNLGLLRDRQGY